MSQSFAPIPPPTPETSAEALQREARDDLIMLLSKADPWNHYYPNLREGLHKVLSQPKPTMESLSIGLSHVQQVLLKLIAEDPDLLVGAPAFNEVGFQGFLNELDNWVGRFEQMQSAE